jgi:SAM-dependent methyltransferase
VSWEDEAQNWIAWARASEHDAYRDYAPAFFELVPPSGRATVEIGCGEGRVARDLATRGHTVTGVDSSPTLLKAARESQADAEFVLADAASLPFPDKSFDLAVAYNSLMDIDDMPGAVCEVARVLEPGGRFCVCVTHPLADAGRFESREPDAAFVLSGSYFGRRRFEETFARDGLTMTFRGWCYPFEEYSLAFEAAGLAIEALREPRPRPEAVTADEGEARWERLPMFLFLRLRKLPAAAAPRE